MLKSILNDSRLTKEGVFSIVLLPPYSDEPYTFDYLARHVVHVSFLESTGGNGTSKPLGKKEEKEQWLTTISGNTLRSSHGCIIATCNNTYVRANIVYTRLLHNNNGQCTHLLLYLDKDIMIDHNAHVNKTHNSHAFKTMIRELRHKDDIIPIIDSLVLNFCETSVSCNSLTSLHSCMKDILKAGYHMIQSSRSITKTDAIYAAFENYIMEETYDAAFFKIAQLLFDEDRKLTSALDELQYLDFTQIGLPTYVKDERRQVQRATVIFEKIGSFRTPSDKLDCLLHTISELTGQDEYSVGTDALVPLLLMTLIRSKVPHLTANLVYMKDYNFEKDITIGRCGYALSTLEAVLNYILSSTISELSCQNEILWRLIMLGELESFKRYYSAGSFQRRDKDGNNALLLACMHGQADILEYIITQEGIKETDINDTNMTPLMYAVKSKSHRTVDILLQHPQVLSTLNQRDKYGYTAILYASSTNDLAMLIRLVPYIDTEKQLVNDCTGDSILHIAALNHCSTDFIFYLLDICQRLDMQHLVHWKNKHGQTFYHVCSDHALIKSLLCQNRIDLDYIFKDTDKLGQCPLMTWASLGRLDLLELFVGRMDNQQLQAADHDGRTILHLLALRLGKGLTMGEKSLDFIVEQFKHLIHARDWPNGNTALHLAVETAVLANTKNTITFIKAVHRHGGQLDVMNSRGEQPVDMSRISEVTLFLDELILNTSFDGSPKRYSTLGYLWTVTRGNFKKKDSNIEFVIKSGQVGRPETMKMVKRSVCDFLLLRNELQYEMPHVFLPTLSDMIDLSRIRLDPVPFLLVNTVLQRLQSFMSWLQHHPVLCYHDLVLSFVRSSAKLEPSVIRNHSFSRRRLILEKLSDSVPVLSSMMNMREQEYFFKYIQDAVNPLRVDYLKTLNAGRRMTSIRQDLQVEQSNIVSTLEPVFEGNSDIVETIKVCANAMCNHASLLPFLKACQVRYDLMEGIVLCLQNPVDLINKRQMMVEIIENQKERLGKSRHFLINGRKIEQEKYKVIENMEKVNEMDNQIIQSHQIISDELAHFQTIHSKEMIKNIKGVVKNTLEIERYNLAILIQSLNKFSHLKYYLCLASYLFKLYFLLKSPPCFFFGDVSSLKKAYYYQP